MLKYLYTQVYTSEIPGEISLGISFLGCNIHCKGCHSPQVWDINSKGVGIELTFDELESLIDKQNLISCILFYGGEWDIDSLRKILLYCRENIPKKTALYTGKTLEEIKDLGILEYLDYIKVGPYIEELGGLRNETTNQRLYKVHHVQYDAKLAGMLLEDITDKFWRKPIG